MYMHVPLSSYLKITQRRDTMWPSRPIRIMDRDKNFPDQLIVGQQILLIADLVHAGPRDVFFWKLDSSSIAGLVQQPASTYY